jgi:3-oxoacyl-[acyl-carrier-protein] synthase-3
MGARILGTGHFVPDRVLTNNDLAQRVDTSDEWIVRRTGIRARHLLGEEDVPADMAIAAGRDALDRAGLRLSDVGLLIVATNFPELICPGTAPFVADGLGLGNTPFFDLKAGCSGFVYGLSVADAMITSGACKHVLLVGSEALSRVTDWLDRKTCVLFGDGAGAVVLGDGASSEGVLSSAIFGDPEKAMLLAIPAGGTRTPASPETVESRQHFVQMEGAGVYRSAVPMMAHALRIAVQRADLAISEVDWIIPHQANLRIIESLVRRLGVREDRVIVNLDRVANTSTASIPIALDEALRDGRIEPGQIVALTAFGAGATYAATVLRI